MAEWVLETARHIINNGTNKIYTHGTPVYDVIDLQKFKEGEDVINFVDNDLQVSFVKFVTNDSRFYAYIGVKYLQTAPGRYNSCLSLIIYDIGSNSYLLSDVARTRKIERFRTKMYDNTKILVFKELYNFFYMVDINYEEDI